jgi:hypothetical protein
VLSHRPQLVIWQTGSHAALGAGDVEVATWRRSRKGSAASKPHDWTSC